MIVIFLFAIFAAPLVCMNSWKKKVGLHLADQLRVSGDGGANGSDGEKLAYCVNPPVSSANLTSHGDDMAAQLRRKVSRAVLQ